MIGVVRSPRLDRAQVHVEVEPSEVSVEEGPQSHGEIVVAIETQIFFNLSTKAFTFILPINNWVLVQNFFRPLNVCLRRHFEPGEWTEVT